MINRYRNRWQKEYRKRTNNRATYKYEKTISGFLMRMYRNMESRVKGIQKNKWHLYKGKYLLPRGEFYRFALLNEKFKYLFKQWIDSGYNQKITPSINRIDPLKGYELNNIEFITHSENSRLGAIKKEYV